MAVSRISASEDKMANLKHSELKLMFLVVFVATILVGVVFMGGMGKAITGAFNDYMDSLNGRLHVALICESELCDDPVLDIPLKEHLINDLGCNVDTFSHLNKSWVPKEYGSVVISESIGSWNTKWLKEAKVGILTVEGANSDEFSLGVGPGNSHVGPDTSMNILDNTHYITQPFPLGPLEVATRNGSGGYMVGWSNDVNLLGTYNNNQTMSKLLAVEAGGVLSDDSTAVERRVFFGASVFSKLNSNGIIVFDRALNWVAHNTEQ